MRNGLREGQRGNSGKMPEAKVSQFHGEERSGTKGKDPVTSNVSNSKKRERGQGLKRFNSRKKPSEFNRSLLGIPVHKWEGLNSIKPGKRGEMTERGEAGKQKKYYSNGRTG